MPVRTSIPCKCGGQITIYLVERTLVATCASCKESRPAREAPQNSHPRLQGSGK